MVVNTEDNSGNVFEEKASLSLLVIMGDITPQQETIQIFAICITVWYKNVRGLKISSFNIDAKKCKRIPLSVCGDSNILE